MSDLLEYKCPCCGGAIEFNSTLQKMKCPYCDTEFDMETVKEFNEAAANQQSDELNWESASDNSWKEDEASGMSVYICQSCGGEIVADESTGASSCPFCGNPVVMSGKFSGTLRPDFIIPFKLDKKAAKEGLTKHLHGKIDQYGLDKLDRQILTTLIVNFKGGPVGLDTLAAAIGEDSGTLEDVYEPYLLKNGFLNRTPRGRMASALAYEHLGFPVPEI